MCGIIGITSKKYIKNDLLKCLSNLEYRGYDSVGVYINKLIKKEGRVKDLIIPSYLDSKVGLGHSRWATHGGISKENAHPFESDNFVLVHNGIISNYLEFKEELELLNYKFKSETDSEVILYLLECYFKKYNDVIKVIEKIKSIIKTIDNILYFIINHLFHHFELSYLHSLYLLIHIVFQLHS